MEVKAEFHSLESMKLDSLAANMKILNDKIDNLTKKAKREVCMIKWASKKDWFDAIKARKSGTATKKQIELLDKGHYRKGRKK